MLKETYKKWCIAFLQLAGTLVIIFVFHNTVLITLSLLLWWGITFYPFSKQDLVLFFLTSLFFTLVDISVLHQGIFAFTDKDFFGMPYFEVFMWGFYFLHASRLLQGAIPTSVWQGIIFSGVIFLALSAIPNISIALIVGAGILIGALFYFGTKKDVLYSGYLMLIGVLIEYLGTATDTWKYSIDNYFYWWVITWAVSGLVLYRTMLPLVRLIVIKFFK